MQLSLKDNLPFTTVTIVSQGKAIEISDVLIDTGSGSTIFAADVVASVGIAPSADDVLYTIRGVGGAEVVFTRQLESLFVGDKNLPGFEIEIGGMDYGFEINGILGMDFLLRAGTLINLHDMKIEFSHDKE